MPIARDSAFGQRPIILDTDVGTDVDDAFAIVQAVRSPELKLEAVTTVYGDVQLRARIARKLLNLLGRADVPVAAGAARPLTPGREVYWGGWEGEGFLRPEDAALAADPRPAVDLIIETVEQAQEPVTLVAIGPLTNIAMALQRQPGLARRVAAIICMAGTIVPGEEEWNVQCDAEAARIVFESGAALTLGTRFIVNRPRLGPAHRARLARSADPAVAALVAMLDIFLAHKRRDSTPMYDPVTLSMAYSEAFIQTQPLRLAVNMDDGVLHLEPRPDGPAAMNISVGVEAESFVDHLVDRLLNPLT